MRRFVKATWIFYPLILAALMRILLPLFPTFTEYVISRGLFKIVTVPVGFITSLLPFSLTELLVILALPLVIFLIILFILKMRKSSSKKKTAVKAGRFLCGFLSFTLLMYMICHGANFYRYSTAQLMGLDTSQKTPEQLLAVCMYLGEKAAELREELPTDENGVNVVLPEDIYTELERASNGYEPLVEEYPWLWTSVSRQKPVQLSYYWSYTGIVGMYFPFFAECNVNTEQPDYSIPFTAAHESAHSRGIAFEDECNFYAFLSCINSEYPEYRYSGYMEAFMRCSNALYDYDIEMWAEAQSVVTEGMKADFHASNKYIYKFSTHVIEGPGNIEVNPWEVGGDFNNTFLEVQGVEDGSLSYDRVTELILAYYYTDLTE